MRAYHRPSPKRANDLRARKAACTHTRASRLFDEEAPCSHCGAPGDQGWVYRCTQDSDGRLSIRDSGLNNEEQAFTIEQANINGWAVPGITPSYNERAFRAEDDKEDITLLKTWMIKAIAERQYTPAQVKLLISQRTQVRTTIKADDIRTALDLERTMIEELARKKRDKSQPGVGVDGSKDRVPETKVFTLEERLYARRRALLCEYRCCPACRPIMRDRAWVPIESVLNPIDPDEAPEDFDLRPLAPINVLRGIDINRPLYPPTPSLDSSESSETGEYYTGPDELANMHADFLRIGAMSSSQSSTAEATDGSDNDDEDEDRMAALGVLRPESRLGEPWLMDNVLGMDPASFTPNMLRQLEMNSMNSMFGLQRGEYHSGGTNAADHTSDNDTDELTPRAARSGPVMDTGMGDIIAQV